MSSEPKGASVENASEGKDVPIERQEGASMLASSTNLTIAQAPELYADLHNHDVLQEKVSTKQDPMHSLPQGDAKSNEELPTNLPDYFIQNPEANKIPEYKGDPYEYLFKLRLEKDSDRCTTWKDEVENTLIFAGLFSAVVTAFIIESYQRLQPDSNDAMLGLLAHIANRLDNAPNNTESVGSIITGASFSPSRSDISINVFWFISLVLSLTAALIGIITLQWLREHQRYDMTHKPQERLAILNARLHSLEQWYVPQIFTGLPLLLQGALILFFTGMVEFLFALHLEVAIPVTLSICVPIIFLIATTVLPLLQVCVLQDAFRLSFNDNIPAPCPYKSPQSFIARRVGLGSSIIFQLISSVVASAYICVVKIICFKRRLEGNHPPIFHSQPPELQSREANSFPDYIGSIIGRPESTDPDSADPPDNWISIDETWMRVRSTYALSLQMVYRDDINLVLPRNGLQTLPIVPAELFDCTSSFQAALRHNPPNVDLFNALYVGLTNLSNEAWKIIDTSDSMLELYGGVRGAVSTDLLFAFGRSVCDVLNWTPSPIGFAFIEDVILHDSSEDKLSAYQTVYKALMLCWMYTMPDIWQYGNVSDSSTVRLLSQLVTERLGLGPERLFSLTTDEWLPCPVLEHDEFLHEDAFSSSTITTLFHTFFKDCSEMQPNTQLEISSIPARDSYRLILTFMRVNVRIVSDLATIRNLAHLTQLCSSTPPQDLIQHKPFLLIAACCYLDMFTSKVDPEYGLPLVGIITKACGTAESSLDRSGWSGLDDAINAIHNHHHPSRQQTRSSEESAHVSVQIDYDKEQ